MRGRFPRRAVGVVVAACLFLLAFGFYALTGPSDLAWMSGAEYQRRVVQAELGEGPWDQPLFVLLSQPFLLIPRGEVVLRANWAAAAFAAGACLYVYLLMRLLLQMAPQFISRRVGVLAAVSLAVSHTFWMRAVTPGPEPLDALLLAAMLYHLVRYASVGGSWNLYLGMGVLGLALANNLLFVFLVPVVLLYARIVQPPLGRDLGRTRLRGVAVFLIGSSLAVGVTLWGWYGRGFDVPPEQTSWLAFWSHMRLSWEPPLRQSLVRFGSLLLLNFPPWTAAIGLIGFWELYRRQKYVFWLVAPSFLVYAALVVALELPAPVTSYLPAWVFLSVGVGFGWWRLLSSGSWQGFAVAILLSASPLVLYRFAPALVREAQLELRAEALFGVAKELPVPHLDDALLPDRRGIPEARDHARAALFALPEGAVVISPSRTSELVVAPIRYLAEVESRSPVRFVTLGDDGRRTLSELTSRSSSPLFVMGLHPPHPALTALLGSHRLRAVGHWFELVPRAEPYERATIVPAMAAAMDALGDSDLLGRWMGYVEPQGYPLLLSVEGAEGSLTGAAVLNPEGARPRTGRFTRLSSTLGAVLGSVEYGEEGKDRIHFHIDATQEGNRLAGAWRAFELPRLEGRFVVWKQE